MKCDIFNVSQSKTKTIEATGTKPCQAVEQQNTKTQEITNMKHVLRLKTRFVASLTGRAAAFAVFAVVIAAGVLVPVARADVFDEQIKALQNSNAEAGYAVTELQSQANSYQDAISKLQVQISNVQAQIAANQAEQVRIAAEIVAKQAELDRQRQLLGAVVQSMYVDGEMSTIEMLATSDNLSDYVDKEEYRNTVQENIQDSLAKITALQDQLKIQKVQVEQLIDNQEAQQVQLAADQYQQNQMLAYTEAQKNEYTSTISANTSKIGDLRKQQIIANARFVGTGPAGNGPACGGGYPARYCEIAQDAIIDAWGMYNRECVSYTAFKVHQDFLAGQNSRDMPYWGGVGNANQWDENAVRAGIPVNSTPERGAIAVSNAGYYGHVMYVEGVNGDGTINISQYNASLNGRYSERAGVSTAGLVFIHF